jgi:NAD(P)-dependent dehydrogenase (short-subunit alcohol dehydrogenase family)
MVMEGTGRRLFITGVSSGFGRALTEAAIDAGHTVVGTVRRDQDAAAIRALGDRAHASIVDVTDDEAIEAAVARTERELGPIDVVVANAGYGHEGTMEESSMDELRRQFDVNVFGSVATIKAALPFLRSRRAGHIIGITSMAGLMTIPGLSFYHGSKFALEGMLGSLAKEVGPLGIRVTAVAPGSFRTEWAGRSMVRSVSEIADYESIFAPLRAARQAAHGQQLGHPGRAAAALIAMDEPPVHLLLGSDAIRLVEDDRAQVDRELARWTDLSASTDLPDGAQIVSS